MIEYSQIVNHYYFHTFKTSYVGRYVLFNLLHFKIVRVIINNNKYYFLIIINIHNKIN